MNDVTEKIPFKEVSERLYQEMVEREYEGEPLESKATAYLNYALQRERIRQGATDIGQRQDAVDYETLEALKNADSDDPQHAHAMLAFQRLGVDPIKAVEYVERLITSRKTEISQKMTVTRAKNVQGVASLSQKSLMKSSDKTQVYPAIAYFKDLRSMKNLM